MPILSNLVIIKTWKEFFIKKILIYFWLPIWFYGRLFDFFNKFENRGYISEAGSSDCVREEDHGYEFLRTTPITVGGGGETGLFLVFNNRTLLVGGGNGQDFLSELFFTFMKKNLRFQFKNIIRSVLYSSSFDSTRKWYWQSGLYGFGIGTEG